MPVGFSSEKIAVAMTTTEADIRVAAGNSNVLLADTTVTEI